MTKTKQQINDAFNLMPDELAGDLPGLGETSEQVNYLFSLSEEIEQIHDRETSSCRQKTATRRSSS